MKPKERLSSISTELADAQTQLRILEEQLEFVQEVAEDARIRALVSETPLADREAREAREDLERMRRSVQQGREAIDALRTEQDRLLERLFEGEA